jgi:hypothetical protein
MIPSYATREMIWSETLVLFVYCDGYDLCSKLCLWCSISKDSVVQTKFINLVTIAVDLNDS